MSGVFCCCASTLASVILMLFESGVGLVCARTILPIPGDRKHVTAHQITELRLIFNNQQAQRSEDG